MTSRYALVGRWYADPARLADQDRDLREVIMPSLRDRPGFVAGYWTRDPESGRTHATILFTDEAAARGCKAELDAGRRQAATLGAVNDYLIVAHVLAELGESSCPASAP